MKLNKQSSVFWMFWCALFVVSGPVFGKADILNVYVSATGKDSGYGTKKSPFLTLEKARDFIRTQRAKGKADSATVYLGGGVYPVTKTFRLEAQDSRIAFKAWGNGTPQVVGARKITGWKRLQENLPQVSSQARDKLYVADVEKGWRFHYLFVGGERAERSKSSHEPWRKWPKDHKFEEGEGDQIVHFENKEQLRHLPSNGDVELVCIMYQYGVMGNGVVSDVNTEAGTLKWNSKLLQLRYSRDAHERGYCFENALCLIDRPGEWAVNSQAGKVYYWPKEGEDLSRTEVVAPCVNELVRLQGNEEQKMYVHHVTFDGITFAYTDRLPEDEWPDEWLTRQWENVDAAVYMSGTHHCRLVDCRLLHTGAYGITMNHYAMYNVVERCEIGWTGSGGIFLEGYGPGTLDVNKYNRIERNYIHDHGLGNYWHSPSVQLYQSGHNYIAYNLLQRSAYNGISMVGCHYKYLNDPKIFFPGTRQGLHHQWNDNMIRYDDFSAAVQQQVREGKKPFDRTNVKQYLHSRNNQVEYNIISEPHSKLNEGGALYAWCTGKDNKWLKNVTFKSSGMPGSSIYALDDIAEYFTVKDNVYWIEGIILNGVGSRPTERGNTISGNVRVNFKKAFEQRYDRDKKGRWHDDVEGREPLDRLLDEIKGEAARRGGWPAHAAICVPAPGEKITKYGEELILPENAHVTIE